MNTDPITIDIVSKPGQEPYRARMRGTKIIATAMSSAELAVGAVALKHWRGHKVQVKHIRGEEWQATVEPGKQYHVGDRISYQTDMMADPGESVVTEIMATGLRLDGKAGAVFARWHEIVGVVPVPAAEDAAPAASAGAAPAVAAQDANVGSGEAIPASPAGDEGQSPTFPAAAVDGAMRCTSARALCAQARSATLETKTPGSQLPALLRRDLQVTLPSGKEAYAAAIRENLDAERLGGVRAAVLIACQRQEQWPEDNQFGEWLEWAMPALGLCRRSACMYLKAGRLLLSEMVLNLNREQQQALLGCTVPKLEQLARLDQRKLAPLLERNPVASMTRDDIKELVEKYLCTTQQLKQRELASVNAAARAVFTTARDAVRTFAAIPEEKLAEVAKRAGAGLCTAQGVRMTAAGIMALDSIGADEAPLYRDYAETLRECADKLDSLKA